MVSGCHSSNIYKLNSYVTYVKIIKVTSVQGNKQLFDLRSIERRT